MSSSDGSGGCQLRIELALNDFEHFLSADKGLSVITRECYVRHVLSFLTEVGGDTAGVVNLGGVSAQRVRSYVTDLGGRYSPQSLKLIATAIRSFLGFAWISGWTVRDLRLAVGAVVTHRFGRLPRRCPVRISDGCWRFRTAERRWGLGTTPYSSCCPDWVCALARSPGCASTTSTGVRRRSLRKSRAGAGCAFRYLTMWGRQWWPT